MDCPDCQDKMVRHTHGSWPRQTYHCACGLVAYYAKATPGLTRPIEILVDPLDEDLEDIGIEPPPIRVNSPQQAYQDQLDLEEGHL